MKKIKCLLIMVVAIMMTVSCSKDDDDDSLVGSWENVIPKVIDSEGIVIIEEFSIRITFNKNSSCEVFHINISEQEGVVILVDIFEKGLYTWSTNKNKLTLIPIDESNNHLIKDISYSISGNELRFYNPEGGATISGVPTDGTYAIFTRL
jgi:hypothetical protein